MKLLILTGMSGSGKHTAFKFLEDFGYNCVDNLPIPLLKSFVDLTAKSKENQKVAVTIDIRSGNSLEHLQDVIEELDADGREVDILFMEADDAAIIKRYKETRRTHPLSGNNERIEDGILRERERMKPLKRRANYVIDTSHLLTRELRAEMQRIFVEDTGYKNLFVTVLSFGFKYGIPTDADLVFDVRFLPNPYYDANLRPLTGNDEPIRRFVMKNDDAHIFIEKLYDLISFLIPNYINEGKTQLVICIGCTGGKHRSVTLANALYERLAEADDNYGVRIEHRDIAKDAMRGK